MLHSLEKTIARRYSLYGCRAKYCIFAFLHQCGAWKEMLVLQSSNYVEQLEDSGSFCLTSADGRRIAEHQERIRFSDCGSRYAVERGLDSSTSIARSMLPLQPNLFDYSQTV